MAVLAASCADDLNTEYYGYYVSTEQKGETLEKDPAKAQAGVTGTFATLNQCRGVYEDHFDFGFPAIMMGLDLQTEDYMGKANGYNWHLTWQRYRERDHSGTPTGMMWNYMYKQIYAANALIATIDPETENEELMFYLANGLTVRAFDYFTLVQCYQFNYTVNPEALGLPLLTEKNQDEAAAEGCARSTVAETYALIESDLDAAIGLLEKSSVTPEKVISTKPKRMVSLATAYGMRARVHLVKHEYAKAAEFAQKAITAYSGRPYSIAEVSKPAFTSLDDESWMWGMAIAETDRVVTSGIVNFPSFCCTFAYRYVQLGAWKACGYKLWNYIPSTDVRKGWFLDDNYDSPNINDQQRAYISTYIDRSLNLSQVLDIIDSSNSMYPQTNVKFDSYQGVLGQNVNASDIPYMRIEEMYYILAEGQAMSGNPTGGLQTLVNFVKTYRDPAYAFNATAPEAIQEEIWWQRRVELWGEGQAFYDVMRLNKGIDRRNNREPYIYRFVIEPLDPVLLYCVPQSEITANRKISIAQGNEAAPNPKPVNE